MSHESRTVDDKELMNSSIILKVLKHTKVWEITNMKIQICEIPKHEIKVSKEKPKFEQAITQTSKKQVRNASNIFRFSISDLLKFGFRTSPHVICNVGNILVQCNE